MFSAIKSRTKRRINKKVYHSVSKNVMPDDNITGLTSVKNGIPLKVVEISGPEKSVNRLNSIGIIPGTVIIKKSSSAMRGPVVIEKNGIKIAIGYHMAQMIFVEHVTNNETDQVKNI